MKTTSIDGQRIAARDPETACRRRTSGDSYRKWLNKTFVEEEAAQTIQSFIRSRLMTSTSSLRSTNHTSSYTSASTVSITSQDSDGEDEGPHYDVFLWHGTVLGLSFFSCNITGYPCVEDEDGNDSLPGMWNLRAGDFLVSINGHSTHREAIDFDAVMQILEDGVRPAVLRFRRPQLHEMRIRRRESLCRSAVGSKKKDHQRRRERLERSLCYIVWREEDGALGIVLKPDRNKPYPMVSEVNLNGVVAQKSKHNMIKAGDLLLSINHMDVHAIGYRTSLEILKFAPRPIVLTFRRTSPQRPMSRSMEL